VPHKIKAVIDHGLAETKFGEWEGMAFSELNKRTEWQYFNRLRSWNQPPNGELMIEIQNRMVATLRRLWQAHMNSVVAIVSHADPLRLALAYFLGTSLDHMQRIRLDPASVSIVQLDESWIEIMAINRCESIAL